MSRRNVEDLYPLSPLQQGLLFHSIEAPGSGIYVEQLSCTLHGELNLDAFERAWQQTVDRHPILRTAFIWEGLAEPVQVVRRRVSLPFAKADWRGQSASEQEESLRVYLRTDLQQGFDLAKAPLLRIALLRLADDSYKFVWSYHHLMLDGWCIPLLLHEVFAFYDAFAKGQSLSLDRPRPYRDYIAWLQQQDISEAEAFWRQNLKGFTTATPFSVDKLSEPAASRDDQKDKQDGYRDQQLSIPEDTTSALTSVTRQHGLTLNTLVQGAWAILLSRYSGEQDVVFGVTVAGRPAELSGVESMIGLFINTLPVRVKVDRGQAVASWLKQLQVQQAELRQYEYSPLVQVQGWSEVPRGSSLFDSLLVFENYPVDASFRQELARLSISDVQKIERTNYPLTLLALPGTQLSLRISYDSRRFDDATVKRMLGHLQTMLEAIALNPSKRLAELPLLTSAEERQLIEWNSTDKDYPRQLCLHELFEAQVERTPDAVALVFDSEQLSYRELNQRANQLARRLRASGVGAETRVGICVERSLEMVVGLLGILKAGGAYVPLEPAYPAERLAFMLEDAQVSLLLTQGRLLGALPEYRGEVVFLERDREENPSADLDNVLSNVTSQNAAYVIYTSGSTGRPKGVVNTHRGICNRLRWMQDEYRLTSADRVLQKTPFSFDVSLWEFFWPLATGARLVIARPEGHQDTAYLARLIAAEEITTLHFVPSMLQAFLSEPELEKCRSLRRVICSGEALSQELQKRFYNQLPAELHNLYGPTEAAVDVSYWACERNGVRRTVPIGRPIANTQLHILSDDLQRVPIGVAGELYIGGIGLARGYLNRPELTAEKFIANPFSAEAGTRLYRTGDQARFLEGGEIEFLGRLDQQVKLRGFRIELEEIEAALAEHPTVRECVVVLRDDLVADPRLVAYAVAVDGNVPSVSTLRSFLRVKLPEYMLPSNFVWLATFPLTPNGKLDRSALPAPERARATDERSGELGRNPLEEVVRGIWADVLKLEEVGGRDNFFELGGHSILALQVISRLRRILAVEVPVRELFEAPTVAGFTERIEKLRRSELWELGELSLPLPPLRAVSRDKAPRVSFAQQRLWFLDQLEPESTAYNIPAAMRLKGQLNTRALEESFNEVIRRHEVLRTGFATVDGRPVQRIARELRLALRVEDLQQVAGEQREAVVQAIAAEEAARTFNLEQPPLLRLRVLRVDEEEHVLLLTMHHIISDGWSLGVLIREVATLYEAFSNNQPSPLAELPLQYADFAEWQREWLEGEVLETQLAYWKQQLDGSPPRLQLPSSLEQSVRQQSPAFQSAKVQFALSAELSKALKRLSRRADATLFMTLLAALQTLLYRYTGADDINVGTPVANRNHDEVEGLIGFFVNTLVLRTDLSGDPAFAELLKRVREVCLGAYAHQDVPFEKLVEELQPERDLSHSPLFQVMFVLQNTPLPAVEVTGLTFSPLAVEKSGAQFDLTLSMEETRDGLQGLWEYNTSLFDAPAIARLIAHFQNLLEAITSDPSQKLSDLQLLTADERRQSLVEWNDTRIEYARESCLHELFEQQVEQTPEALAVSFVAEDGGTRSLTYSELNNRANQLARHLSRLGVGAETLVGVLSERSPEMLVGVLGVLKAGAAYLLLDPAYPGERLSYMIEDARPRVLLVQSDQSPLSLWERVRGEGLDAPKPSPQPSPSGGGRTKAGDEKRFMPLLVQSRAATVVYLDDVWKELAEENAANLLSRATPENLAYVIYTSGSTGTPKGVMVSHRGLANLSLAEAAAFNLQAETKVLQFASWSFDASVFEMVMALTAGATLCLAPPGAEFAGDALTRFLREQEINTIALTPTTLAAVPLADLPDLQTIITGGEPCPAELVARWANGHRFFNVYGPTETTTWATFAECRDDGSTPNIGRPITNTKIYILNASLQPVPVGVSGELHIGGVALARGYLNRPALTAEKFIPNPFSTAPGARLYRTGDIARYRDGGEIEFVGRTDGQVKLRGFRIELGEIEATLARHEAVQECAVIVREDVRDEQSIVAYVVLDDEASAPTTGEWRGFLKEKLPDHMIPAAFVVLEAWPLTPNGKLDRGALPAPEFTLVAKTGSASTPRTPVEEMLVDTWADLLRLERVGIHANFFDLGGHSLLATQLVSRVREVFKVELPLRDFFAAPTVADLAARIESLSGAEQGLEITPILATPRDGELSLSFAQQRLWFLDELEPGNPFYNVPSAVLLSGALDVAALRQSINEVVRRHEILRTSFQDVEGQPRQVIAPELVLRLPLVHLEVLPDNDNERRAEVQRLAVEEAQRSFDLAAGPLVRARLLQTGAREHVLLFTMHHIVSDGWSINVLVREVAALYQAYTLDEPSPLPELAIQYADFAAWQREWLSGKQIETQLSYWREQLRDVPALLELPTDHPRPPLQTYHGATARFTLPQILSAELQQLSRREGVTLFMTLLAAFQVLLHRYSGADDVVVGTPMAGQNRTELEPLIGFFVNTLVLRTTFGDDPSFVELLERVRDVCLGAYAHQDLPFEKLVEELQPTREMSHSPLFQVMFTLQNAMTGARLPGLELMPLEVESGVAKFDLTLGMSERAEGLAGLIEYNTDLFEPESIERMMSRLMTLLEGIVADPERRVSELPMMNEPERRLIVEEWNETQREYGPEESVAEIFERQAQARPEAVALVCDGKEWTYREINKRANQLAHYLRSRGVEAEQVVGVLMERSAEMVIGLLAVLKAGGAYLPLEASYPKERLAFMLEDARISLLLTEGRLLQTIPENSARVVSVDAERTAIARESEKNIPSGVSAHNLAYVIYTSGSTGQPKGVCVTHHNLFHSTCARFVFYPDAPARFLLLSSFAFDSSVAGIFWTLCGGGALVLPAEGLQRDGLALVQLIAGQRVTHLLSLPALHALMLEVASAGELESLRMVIVAGEACAPELVREHQARLPETALYNEYGPTEATVWSSVYQCVVSGVESEVELRSVVPIGRPIANARLYILDDEWRPVPLGVAGELYIGGLGISRGYLHRSEVTAERFIPDPFSTNEGARLYRTGDWARYLPDGNIEFLRRIDRQVKLRGFRIELGEIEAALAEHEGVRQTAVVVREDEPDNKRIVAYVVPNSAGAAEKFSPDGPQPPTIEAAKLSAKNLRVFLSERLPDYMLPSAFVFLNEMPRTAGGKVDRRALPAPAPPETSSDFALPRSPIEEMLAGIFSEMLKVERVSIDDNFFELGGHSLLATQVIARARELFQVEVPLRALFEAPSVAGLAERVESLSLAEAESPALPLRPVPRNGELPLSFIQQRFWFLNQLMPESSAYNIPTAVRLNGSLDTEALERSFNEILRRHEILRTTFTAVEGRPAQRIAETLQIALPLIDLRKRPESEREAEPRRIAHEEAQQPFDLERGPLLRTVLLQLDDDEFILLFTMHHIVSDGWSAGVLVRDLTAIYDAFSAGQPSPLPDLPIQFADFAHWQRQWLQGETLASRLAYWRKQFGSGPPVLNLPTDKPRPPVPTDHGANQSLVLSKQLSAGVKALSQQKSVTLFMLLLAAFKVLLHRYTSQDDILVGSSIANRNHVETEGLIGLLINTLILRTDLSGDPTFEQLLQRVREVSLGAYTHQDLPFEQLLDELRAEWDAGNAPVFQVAFQLQNFVMPSMELRSLSLSPFAIEGGTAKFDLSLSVIETPEELIASLEYNTDLFEAATVTRMLDHFRILLESIVTNPSLRISDLPLLGEAERRQLLTEWNPSFETGSPSACLHQMFEAQVKRTPDAVALVFEDQRLTYAELNRRANQLAHYLRAMGVGAETLVAMCVERSVETVVGILGILKAGGAYVPLDAAYPKERLAFMLEDTQARFLLTQQSLAETLPEYAGRSVLLDTDWPAIAKAIEENPAGDSNAGTLAYVIYTSGSTGKPKGTLVTHQNVARLFEATQANFQFDEHDAWTLFHSYAFDFSVWELWGALLYGGRLVIVPYWVARSAEAFHRLLGSEQVTVLNQTPSAFRQLMRVDEAIQSQDLKLRLVIFGGEALELQSLKPWFARHGDRSPRLVNMFGITETTVHVTYRALAQADLDLAAGSVVGRPLACLQVYLLDQRGQLVPVGVPGEICVGGSGVTRGYLNRPELTAERFIPHPFSGEAGARLYRSGDLGRYLADGDIEYLGRIDSQVKVRGFRIELGEIESALAEHARVRECTVIARDDTPGETKLVAYLVAGQVADGQPAPTTTDLRDFLHEKLPEHMIPAAFVELAALPLTPNGKIDHRALPAPDQARPQLGKEFVAPRTPVEQELAAIWQELLGVSEVGIYDDFFELGGHSLLLTQLASWVRRDFQVEVPLRVLFDTPTIIEMTNAILARQVEQENKTDLAEMLDQLKQLSPREVQAMLEKMSGAR